MRQGRSARRAVSAFAMCACAVCVSCGWGSTNGGGAPSPSARALGAGVVLRVDKQEVHEDTLGYVAAVQETSVAEARALVERDALFAAEAEAQGLVSTEAFRAAERGVLSRLMLRELYAEASRGEISELELNEATARRWLELDRPVGFRTVHAVVRFKKSDSGARRVLVKDLAEKIREALSKEFGDELAANPESPVEAAVESAWIERFRKVVNRSSEEGFQVLVESLPPVASDGRVLEPGGSAFAKEFAEAAARLSQRGERSPVVVTEFGAHVIMLLERTPAHVVDAAERKKIVRNDVIAMRVRGLRRAMRRAVMGGAGVDGSDPSVDALLSLVPIGQ